MQNGEQERLERWAALSLAGDQDAFRKLYDACAPRVKAYFLRSGFPAGDADDLTQEAFTRAHRSLKTFDPRRGWFTTWLGAIARNVARRRWKRRRDPESFDPELAEEMLAAPGNPSEASESKEEIDAVRECVETLPPELARLVCLRYVDGRTTRCMAAVMEMAEATVRLRLQEARARILRCLRSKGVGS